MTTLYRYLKNIIVIFTLSLFLINCNKSNDEEEAVNTGYFFYGITTDNELYKFDSGDPTVPIMGYFINGLPAGEKIRAIDFRPATGNLYGLATNNRIYIIAHRGGFPVIPVGSGPITPAVSGTLVGFDFDPTADLIRIVTSSGQNLRINPETGLVVASDFNINPGSSSIAGIAYSNNKAGTASTILYAIGSTNSKLYKINPPNNGALIEVGALGVNVPNDIGFDISPTDTVAFASINTGGISTLYHINLNTGHATGMGEIARNIVALAIQPDPVAYTIDMNNNLQIFNHENLGSIINKTITGLQPGENILGIDMRPLTGQLFALGSSSRLYTINMSSGTATAVSGTPFSTLLSGTSFGFDFFGLTDEIRVISNTRQNLRLNPSTGTVAAVDLPLSPGSPNVSAAAFYNNNSSLAVIDHLTDKAYSQAPHNNGTLFEIGNLGVDIGPENGFDISWTGNNVLLIATSNGNTSIYNVNSSNGELTRISSFPNPIKGLAIGLGF